MFYHCDNEQEEFGFSGSFPDGNDDIQNKGNNQNNFYRFVYQLINEPGLLKRNKVVFSFYYFDHLNQIPSRIKTG